MPIMPVRRYAVCDHCGEEEIRYDTLKDREATDFKYEEIVDGNGPMFAEVERWTVKALQDPKDPIAVMHEFYCPDCSAEDYVEDSGDGLR